MCRHSYYNFSCNLEQEDINTNVKVKWSRYRPGVAQRVGRGIALLFHVRGTRRGSAVSSTPRPHFTPGKDPVPILQEAGWAPGPVWTGGKSRPHRDSTPDRPARSQSLYRLSYPAHKYERKKLFSKSRKITRQIRKIMCIIPTFIYCTQESFFINQNSAQRSYIVFVPYKIMKIRLSPLCSPTSKAEAVNRYSRNLVWNRQWNLLAIRPASWSSGQGLWLLIMRSRVRFPVLPWEFFLAGKDSRGDHGLGS